MNVRSILFQQLILYVFCYVTTNSLVTSTTTEPPHAASKFKAPNSETPKDVTELWKKEDEDLWSYVEEKVPAVLDHTGDAAFDQHLKGVQSVLRFWGAPKHVTSAGLFHSIYGTEGFQGFSLPLSERAAIQNLIGKEAEKLIFIFCMVDRLTVDETVFAWKPPSKQQEGENDDIQQKQEVYTFRSRPEMGRFQIELNKEEWLDFIELTLADWLEQVEGAARTPSKIYHWKTGEAYAYRRTAYKRMSELLAVERSSRLSKIPKDMYYAVMATESVESRHLIQVRTPPTSAATAAALDALRAIGEPIPVDLSPQPMTLEEQQQCSVSDM